MFTTNNNKFTEKIKFIIGIGMAEAMFPYSSVCKLI